MVRLTGSLENTLYQRIFTRALEDPEFAKAMTRVGTPQEAAKVAAKLSEIGISPSVYVPRATVAPKMEATQGALDMAREPRPAGPASPAAPTARDMLRTLPPAPPTRGTEFNPRLPASAPPPPPASPAAPQQGKAQSVPLMYPALFPNDPISAMLQARQAQISGGASVTPGQ